MHRRNSTATASESSFRNHFTTNSASFGQGSSFYNSQPYSQQQQQQQPFAFSGSDSNSSNRANAILPPIRSASTAPQSHFTSSSSTSFRPSSMRPPSPAGAFRNLSFSSGPGSPPPAATTNHHSHNMPYYPSSSSFANPSAPRSFGTTPHMPPYQRRSSEGHATLPQVGLQPSLVPEKKKLTRARKAAPECCHVCGVADTPEWRRGPTGLRTLCNGCGLQAAKLFGSTDPKSMDEALTMLESIGRARFRAFSYVLPAGARERATKTFNNNNSAGPDSPPPPPAGRGAMSKASAATKDTFEAALSLEALSRTAGSSASSSSNFNSPSSSVSSQSSHAAGGGGGSGGGGGFFGGPPPRARRTSSFGQYEPSPQRPLSRPQTPARPQTPSSFQQQPTASAQAKNRMDLSHLVSPPSRPSSRQERRNSFSFGGSFKF